MIKKIKDWLYYHDEVVVIFWFVLICLLIFGPCMGILLVNNYFSCRADSANLGLESSWNFWGGCYLELDNVWYNRDIAKDILRQQYELDLAK